MGMGRSSAGLLVGVGSQLLWGCYPPLSRYLQTVAGMGTCRLMAASNLLSILSIVMNDSFVVLSRCAEQQLRGIAQQGGRASEREARGGGERREAQRGEAVGFDGASGWSSDL